MRFWDRWWVPLVAGLALVTVGLVGWQADLFGVRSGPPFGSVAAAFEPPPPYPGYAWTRDGRAVTPEQMNTIAGPDHCSWRSATLLQIDWPPGSSATGARQGRIYLRDPNGVMGGSYRERLVRRATLPGDARPTGYRYGSIEIYASPSDQDDAIYVVGPGGAERWPRMDPVALCA